MLKVNGAKNIIAHEEHAKILQPHPHSIEAPSIWDYFAARRMVARVLGCARAETSSKSTITD